MHCRCPREGCFLTVDGGAVQVGAVYGRCPREGCFSKMEQTSNWKIGSCAKIILTL